MKALSIWQPYASLIAIGAKTIETRGWSTSYRGPILIHTAKRFSRAVGLACVDAQETLVVHGFSMPDEKAAAVADLPWHQMLGVLLARANLVDCVLIEGPEGYAPLEVEFGDFRPGRFAWVLKDVDPILPPIPWRGEQGLFEVPDRVIEESAR